MWRPNEGRVRALSDSRRTHVPPSGDQIDLMTKSKKEAQAMYDKKELCEKIREIYPDIGECGIDVDVEYDEAKKAWIVDLKKDQHELKTHLEPEDAAVCWLENNASRWASRSHS
jgi:hypothetical protein